MDNKKKPKKLTDMMTMSVIVKKVMYKDASSGFAILYVYALGRKKEHLKILGTFENIPMPDVQMEVTGFYEEDPKFGRQFRVVSSTLSVPGEDEDKESMVRFIKSCKVPGIPQKSIEYLVDKFGMKAYDVILNDTESLRWIPGIGDKRIEQVKEYAAQHGKQEKFLNELKIFMAKYDISPRYAEKIVAVYRDKSVDQLRTNPYAFIGKIDRLGFKAADEMAMKMGFQENDPRRMNAGLIYALNENSSSDGSCFMNRKNLTVKAKGTLSADWKSTQDAIEKQLKEGSLVEDQGRIYTRRMFDAENSAAKKLLRLSMSKTHHVYDSEDMEALKESMKDSKMSDQQKSAVIRSFTNSVMILTGGPGTGKTSTVSNIIKKFEEYGEEILLAAPTGRAAKRMTETSGKEAVTIHRLLKFDPMFGGFTHDERYPLKGDVLIVDEFSMVDQMLCTALFKAIPLGMRVILVGDVNQLPSVEAGSVLKDLIDSGRFVVSTLSKNFRSGGAGRIGENAGCIKDGDPTRMLFKNSDPDAGFYMINVEKGGQGQMSPEEVAQKTADLVVKYVSEILPKTGKLNVMRDIQVLTPMRKGVCGINELNVRLQKALNPKGLALETPAGIFRLHDKVMNIRNNYEKDVYNGDVGFIDYVSTEEEYLTVRFIGADKSTRFEIKELEDLVLAYACTIHKSQGSEYPITVIPVVDEQVYMLDRKLLYTGVTRAQEKVIVIGSYKTFVKGIYSIKERDTTLMKRIQDFTDSVKEEMEEENVRESIALVRNEKEDTKTLPFSYRKGAV